jgi:hypothetical protein
MNGSDSQLVLRDVPIALWLFGLLFACIGIAIILEGGPPLVIALILFAIGMCFLLFSSVMTVTADRITRMLQLEYRSLLSRSLKQVPFDEIGGINVERSRSGGRGGPTYRLTLMQKDGQVIPFRSFSSSGWKKKERQAHRLREFIGIQESNRTPTGMLPAEFSQAAEIHETNGVHWQIQPMSTQSSAAPTGARWHSPDFKTPGLFLLVTQKAEGQSSGGFLASLGNMFIRQALSLHGFKPEDTPGLDQVDSIGPLDPALERHFMAYSNSPASAGQLLNSRSVMQLADWAGRYPLKQLQSGSPYSQLMALFGPNGVYVVTLNLMQPSQAYELVSLGVELVKCQGLSSG